MAESVQTDQGEIVYSVNGAGPPLVLLPGFMSNRTGWLAPTNYLDLLTDYMVVNIDPLGHGKIAPCHVAGDYSSQLVVDHVVCVLDDVGVESAHIWGFSRGGMIAALMSELAPQRCSSITMAATPPGRSFAAATGQLVEAEPLLAAGNWAGYWEKYPLPLPRFLTEYIETTNDPLACCAIITAMAQWEREVPNFGLQPTDVPAFAFFGSGEVFSSSLAAELEDSHLRVHVGDWLGHAETMLDAAGAVPLVSNFITSLHDHPI